MIAYYDYGNKILSNTRNVLQEKLYLLQICAFDSQLEGCKGFCIIYTELELEQLHKMKKVVNTQGTYDESGLPDLIPDVIPEEKKPLQESDYEDDDYED